jgi:hypothetical protein
MRIKFQLGEPTYDQFTVVIILNIGGRVVGMVVDSVSDVITLTQEQIKPAPEMGTTFDSDYLIGLGTLEQRMLILVDIDKLMSSAEMGLIESWQPDQTGSQQEGSGGDAVRIWRYSSFGTAGKAGNIARYRREKGIRPCGGCLFYLCCPGGTAWGCFQWKCRPVAACLPASRRAPVRPRGRGTAGRRSRRRIPS